MKVEKCISKQGRLNKKKGVLCLLFLLVCISSAAQTELDSLLKVLDEEIVHSLRYEESKKQRIALIKEVLQVIKLR